MSLFNTACLHVRFFVCYLVSELCTQPFCSVTKSMWRSIETDVKYSLLDQHCSELLLLLFYKLFFHLELVFSKSYDSLTLNYLLFPVMIIRSTNSELC